MPDATTFLLVLVLILVYAVVGWVIAIAAWLVLRPQPWARFGGVAIFVTATVIVLEVLPT